MKRIQRLKRVATDFSTSVSSTDQSFQKECDVNEIIRKFKRTGQVSHLSHRQGFYADLSDVPDLMGAFQQVEEARFAFSRLPAELRSRLGNDFRNLELYLRDPANREEAEKFGLLAGRQDVGSKQAAGALGKESKTPREPKAPTGSRNLPRKEEDSKSSES